MSAEVVGALVRDPALTQGGTLLDALGWSFIAMVSALISACLGAVYQPTKQLTAVFLAFSCGLLISLLCFDLMQVALDLGGIVAALTGFFLGLLSYVLMNRRLAQKGMASLLSRLWWFVHHGSRQAEGKSHSHGTGVWRCP